MKKIILFICILFFVDYAYAITNSKNTNSQEIEHEKKWIKQFKYGIGRDLYSLGLNNGYFLKFFILEKYYIKVGGYFGGTINTLPNKDYDTYFNLSLINGYYIFDNNRTKIFVENDISFIRVPWYNPKMDVGICFGFDFFINKHISIGYKFGYYYEYYYNRQFPIYEYHHFQPSFNNDILNGIILYFYFN